MRLTQRPVRELIEMALHVDWKRGMIQNGWVMKSSSQEYKAQAILSSEERLEKIILELERRTTNPRS